MYQNAVGAAIGLSALIELLLLGAFFVGAYFVTKLAVRDGIRESGLIEATRRAGNPPTEPRFTETQPRRDWTGP